uniref:Uncharacterized protein n=1 Tax=viral metagenome TaxID=1070528 RepID=A0A6C0C1F4_9ZZZZ
MNTTHKDKDSAVTSGYSRGPDIYLPRYDMPHFGDDGPLHMCTEIISTCSIWSRYLRCPDSMLPNWICATTQGEPSNLSAIQAFQITLSASYCNASVIRVKKNCCAILQYYDHYCVYVDTQCLGPYCFGEGFPIPPVLDSGHWIIVPCSLSEDVSHGISFCECFVGILSVSVRPAIPEQLLCDEEESYHRLCICKSIPWCCTTSDLAWDNCVHTHQAIQGYSDILRRPAWQCSTDYIMTYSGSLVSLASKSGLCEIILQDSVCIEIPLTCSFATLPQLTYVGGGPLGADQTAMNAFLKQHVAGSSEASPYEMLKCIVSWTEPSEPRDWIKSLPTACRVSIRGTGILDGTRLLHKWASDVKPLKSLESNKATLGEVLQRAEYEILSGLLEIDAYQDASMSAAIIVQGLSIISPPPRFQSSVQLNGYNVYNPWNPDDNRTYSGSVKVRDLKVLGGWSENSSGPVTLSPGSSFCMCLYHLASDAICLGASHLRYSSTTLLQGNAGGCVNIGCNGDLPLPISDIFAEGIYVPRVCQSSGGPKGLGALIVSKNSGTGGSISCCRVSQLHIPFLGGSLSTGDASASTVAAVKGPNIYWRVSAIGYLVDDAATVVPTRMSDIDLLSISPQFLPTVSDDSWFVYYRLANSNAGIAAIPQLQLQSLTLGHMRLTLVRTDKPSETRQTYEETACRIYSFPQDPLRIDYYVCPNALSLTSGVDSYWLAKLTGYDVPTNVQLRNITPSRITAPRRRLLTTTNVLNRLERLV